jgi:hypothetical protein
MAFPLPFRSTTPHQRRALQHPVSRAPLLPFFYPKICASPGSVPVVVRLVGAFNRYPDVLRLAG